MMMTVSVYAFVHLCLVGASKIQFIALPEQKFILHAVKQKFTIFIHINCLYYYYYYYYYHHHRRRRH